MAIEKLTPQQENIGKVTEEACLSAVSQKAEQAAQEKMQEAQEILDKSQQELAQLPEQAITKFNNAMKSLMSMIDGYVDVDSPDFDPNAIIQKIEEMLKPLTDTFFALPIPSIPGLSYIADLLDALKALLTSTSEGEGDTNLSAAVELPSVEIPPTLMATLKRLVNSLMSLCTMLPLVLINLIFQMLGAIIKMFKQIAEQLGVPDIPYPLSLVPECIEMLPNMMDFIQEGPSKIYDSIYGSLKKAYGKITNLQVPQAPNDIKRPESLPTCPLHVEKAQDTSDNSANANDSADVAKESKANAQETLKRWFG